MDVHYQGQVVAAVVAETSEIAKAAAAAVDVEYSTEPPDVVLGADRPDLYAPEKLMAGFETDSVIGDVDSALAAAAVIATPRTRRRPSTTTRSRCTPRWPAGTATR